MSMRRLCLLLFLVAVGETAHAQVPGHSDPTVPEIIVTGERVERTIRQTASSVSVAGADEIEQLAGADRADKLLALLPNVQLGSGGEGPTIRGQDTTGVLRDLPGFLGGTRPRVTLQIDGRPVGYNEFVFGVAPLWDVARVEVFRSPQSTTQGRNSIAGAIFVETKKPSFDWEGGARLLGGNYDSWQASGVVSGPLVDGQIAFRVSGDLRRSRVSSEIGRRALGADPNRDSYGQLRARLLIEPRNLPGARIDLTYAHSQSQAPQIVGVAAPFRDRRDPNAYYGVFGINVDSLTSIMNYQLASALSSRTTLSAGHSFTQRFAPAGLGETTIAAKDFSAETTLNWQTAGPVALLGGVNLHNIRLKQFIDLSAAIGPGNYTDRQQALGLFGEATLRPWPRLTITTGLRYQRDHQDRDGFLGTPAFGVTTNYDRTFAAWLPKLSLAYKVSDNLTAGALVQRATNPGGTTINFETGAPIEFGAESLWNYELFVRGSLADGRVTLAGNVFYNDFSNAQRAQFRTFRVPGGGFANWALIANVPRSVSYGLEFELGWRIDPTLSLHAGVGMLKTKIVATSTPTDPILGKEFQRAPGLTASAAIDWHPVGPLRLSVQLRHNSAYFSNDANSTALRIDGSTTFDARAAYTLGPLTLSAYARNLFDSFHMTYLFSPTSGTAADPREFGLGVDARF